MGDMLSQSEIDALLAALAGGDAAAVELETKTVKAAVPYNFKRPSKFSKEHLRSLEIIFDNFARMASSFLSGYLRTPTTINVLQAEQLTYFDFNMSLANPIILSIIDFHPFKGSIMLDLSPNIGYSIIDRILGGSGVSIGKLREFSEIEKILIERVVSQLITFLPEPWINVVELRPSLEKIETNSQFTGLISPSEIIALVTLNIRIGSMEGYLTFCIPHFVIEPAVKKLNTKYRFGTVENEDVTGLRDHVEERLEKTYIPISAVIGRTNITVSDFVHLQKGDIIPLDSFLDSDLNIMIGSILKFNGKPGISRGRNAIQISSIIRKEE